MPVIHLTLPMPPTVNHYWARAKNGAVYLTKQAKAYKQTVAMRTIGKGKTKASDRLLVQIDLHFADNRKNDLDNRLKGLLDALTHAGVWADDSQIDTLIVRRDKPIKGGLCVVKICCGGDNARTD